MLRKEYPRPQLRRELWQSLNGEWEFSFDNKEYDRKIIVPFTYQTKLSGIENKEFHEVVWYKKAFSVPEDMLGKKILLHFGAVDYICYIYINDKFVGMHEGGQVGFSLDITENLNQNIENVIEVKVEDRPLDLEIPRGKQFWQEESEGIFYTPIMGIWQSVWIEAVEETYLHQVFITPMLDEKAVKIEYELKGQPDVDFEVEITYQGKFVTKINMKTSNMSDCFVVQLAQSALKSWNFAEDLAWTPEHPRLFDVAFRVKKNDIVIDETKSYFGMRKISICNGKIMLNNRVYYQKLLLDQGYWKDSLWTAPTDEAFIKDIQHAKDLGYNGVRKHQKVEDPRFLYHADKMGLLVWGEIGAAYVYSRDYAERMTKEWIEAVKRDYNHPCIVTWVPLNESWGVLEINQNKQQQSHSAAMYYLTKSLDETRLVISNDGWEHTYSDILTIHDYEGAREVLAERYKQLESILAAQPAGRPLYAEGWKYDNQPIMVTEFGGISYQKTETKGWGYTSAASEEEFIKRYRDVIEPILESPHVQGFCYTQLTDVEQEINGLLTYEREEKVPKEMIKKINRS
jgi:Beta-galactosidase/beta-glucuronidase